jgi:hypothetical protein
MKGVIDDSHKIPLHDIIMQIPMMLMYSSCSASPTLPSSFFQILPPVAFCITVVAWCCLEPFISISLLKVDPAFAA